MIKIALGYDALPELYDNWIVLVCQFELALQLCAQDLGIGLAAGCFHHLAKEPVGQSFFAGAVAG